MFPPVWHVLAGKPFSWQHNSAKEAWPISLSVTMHPCHWSPLLTTQHCKGGITHLSLRHHAPLSLKSFADNTTLQRRHDPSLCHHAPLSLKSFADNASLQIPTSRIKWTVSALLPVCILAADIPYSRIKWTVCTVGPLGKELLSALWVLSVRNYCLHCGSSR